MAMPPTSHAFDETGLLPENKITNEERVLPNYVIRGLVAKFGSFYTDSFLMRDALGNIVSQDKYHFGLFNELITEKTGKTVAAAVIVLDSTVQSPVYIDYQCVGGPYGVSNEYIIDLFNQINNDNRPVSWPNILGKPDHYKPSHHLQDIGDLYGAEYFVAALDRLKNAVLMGDNASHDEIFKIIDNNVHAINDTINDAVTNINITINNLKDYVDNIIVPDLTTLINNTKDNLENKINTDVANLKTYVDQQNNILNTKIDNTANTINGRIDTEVNQLSVKIDNLKNYVDNTVVPDLLSKINTVQNNLNNHINDKNNPHETSHIHLNLYTKAEIDDKITAINNNLLNFVRKNKDENTSIKVVGDDIFIYSNGIWRYVWPPQWQ